MRSGDINYNDDTDHRSFRWIGVNGYGWTVSTSTASTTKAYNLGFYASDIYPSGGPNARHIVFPLRCLSTTAVGR